MGKHAILSPSGAHRWMNCPGAPAMEQGQPDPGGAYADEGTAAHFLASECLNNNCDPVQYLNRKIVVGADAETDTDGAQWAGDEETGFDQRQEYEVDGDLISNVRTYCNNVRQYADGNVLMVEFALPIGHLTGEEGATGTGDVVIVADDGDELQLHDLKYGHRHVSPEQNEQLMLYGLGALEAVNLVGYEPKRVRLVIHQPRVFDAPGEWSLTLDELLQFGERVKERARHSNDRSPRHRHAHVRLSMCFLWTSVGSHPEDQRRAVGRLPGLPGTRAQEDVVHARLPPERQRLVRDRFQDRLEEESGRRRQSRLS